MADPESAVLPIIKLSPNISRVYRSMSRGLIQAMRRNRRQARRTVKPGAQAHQAEATLERQQSELDAAERFAPCPESPSFQR